MPPSIQRGEKLLSEIESSDAARMHYKESDNPFLILIDPLIVDGVSGFKSRLDTLHEISGSLPFDLDHIVQVCRPYLEQQLAWRIERTCILELNVARLEGRLEGATSQTRFDSFLKLLGQSVYRLKFFAEYPVLLRQLIQCVEYWIDANYEFLKRLTQDYDQLQAIFGRETVLGRLIDAEIMLGDPHCGGRSVTVACFSSGAKVVYKPRSLAVDSRFQELVSWCNRHLAENKLRTLTVLDKGDYGWMEFVEYSECKSPNEIERFYWRQGSFLALFHVLHASDFHAENVIANADHPVFVDMETLFHPICSSRTNHHADLPADLRLPTTVSHTGLLPQFIEGRKGGQGFDMSGLGATKGQAVPIPVLSKINKGTDQMMMKEDVAYSSSGFHQPRLNETAIGPGKYIETIKAGFQIMYRLLLRNRKVFLANGGPIARFHGVELRRVLRPTYVYALLLFESYHPDLLRDATDQIQLRDRLWAQIRHQPWLSRVVKSEVDDLEVVDIPYYKTTFEASNLMSSQGEIIRNVFHETGKQVVQRQVDALSERDLNIQLWTLDATLSKYAAQPTAQTPVPTERSAVASKSDFIDAACRMGDRLADLALFTNECAFWTCPLIGSSETFTAFAPGVSNFYSGQLGIAFFLGYLGYVTNASKYKSLAYQALQPVRCGIRVGEHSLSGPGVFQGYSGFAYTLIHLGQLYGDRRLFQEAEDVLIAIDNLIAKDDALDVVAGSAGCILALEAIYKVCRSETVLTVMDHCAKHLNAGVSKLIRDWPHHSLKQFLTGFSHGAAGFASALMISASLLDRELDRDLAVGLLNYERSQFSPEHQNWPDYRGVQKHSDTRATQDLMVAWCHGAPGIGISRLRMLPYTSDRSLRNQLLEEVRIAVGTTVREGYGKNHSLCHGDFGNSDFLLYAAKATEDKSLKRQVYQSNSRLRMTFKDTGWRCGVGPEAGYARYQELPGLMVGLAGIGYGLLRLAEPTLVPSILALEEPSAL